MKYLMSAEWWKATGIRLLQRRVPDWCGSGRDTDARRQCGLDGGRQCSDRGRCCVRSAAALPVCRNWEKGDKA